MEFSVLYLALFLGFLLRLPFLNHVLLLAFFYSPIDKPIGVSLAKLLLAVVSLCCYSKYIVLNSLI